MTYTRKTPVIYMEGGIIHETMNLPRYILVDRDREESGICPICSIMLPDEGYLCEGCGFDWATGSSDPEDMMQQALGYFAEAPADFTIRLPGDQFLELQKYSQLPVYRLRADGKVLCYFLLVISGIEWRIPGKISVTYKKSNVSIATENVRDAYGFEDAWRTVDMPESGRIELDPDHHVIFDSDPEKNGAEVSFKVFGDGSWVAGYIDGLYNEEVGIVIDDPFGFSSDVFYHHKVSLIEKDEYIAE